MPQTTPRLAWRCSTPATEFVSWATSVPSIRTSRGFGGVTPLALPDGLPLWVDERVTERERIVLGAGSRSAKVLAAPAILTSLGAEVVPGLAKPAE